VLKALESLKDGLQVIPISSTSIYLRQVEECEYTKGCFLHMDETAEARFCEELSQGTKVEEISRTYREHIS